MRIIAKSEIQTRHLGEIIREVEKSGESLLIMEGNKPVVEIRPVRPGRSVDEVFGPFRGQVTYAEDPNTPTLEEWETA